MRVVDLQEEFGCLQSSADHLQSHARQARGVCRFLDRSCLVCGTNTNAKDEVVGRGRCADFVSRGIDAVVW